MMRPASNEFDTMDLHVPTDADLISILDRVLEKGIVVESWIAVGLDGSLNFRVADARACRASSAVYLGYGKDGAWLEVETVKDFFPYWRRALWTK